MGCTQSKIENEETVLRCKERKHFMKEAVSTRNAFAAAHSGYTVSLKNTGAALSDYAQGEVQFPSASGSSAALGASPSLLNPPYEPIPPPPPPPPNFSPSPLQRAATMPEISIPRPEPKHTDSIIEEENEDEVESESIHGLRHRSSKSGGGGGGFGGRSASSRREEENLPVPPSPPRTPPHPVPRTPPHPPPESKGMSSWDFFFPSMENVPGSTLSEVDDSREMGEEIERKMFEERAKRAEVEDADVGGRKNEKVQEAKVVEKAIEPQELPLQPPQAATKVVKRVKNAVPAEGKRKGGPNVMNLLQIFTELDDCFLKASGSAHEVTKMLEAHRLHYHSNFADNRGNIDHSARVMKVITWNRSFRGLQNVDDGKDDFDSEEHETHATVLDKMLAWEKKLYDEVKAGEQMKLEYQKKVASLNKLKKHGTNTEALEKLKAAVSHLHTRYIVDMQSMDSTVSEINRLRDEQLYPKLVALVEGMATMWETMKNHHESQSKIVQVLRSLDLSHSPKVTTEHHHERTHQLHGVIQEWHSHFEKLMINQKNYIKALNNWLKLNLIPIDTNLKEKVSSPQRLESPPIQELLHAWHDYLEKLPDVHAKTAVYNFGAVINTIYQYQEEEMKLKDKCEATRKDLIKKSRHFEDWCNKYMQRRTPPDEMDPDREMEKEAIAERQLQVDIVKRKLEEEEEAYEKQCIQVREKSLTSLKTCLPEVFRAMSDFSLACSDMYRNLRSIQLQKKNESL